MGVAVDEPRERAQPAPVELLDVPPERTEIGHPPHLDDAAALAQDVRVLEHIDPSEIGTA